MIRRLPRSTRTDTLCPYTTLFRSGIIATNFPIRKRLPDPASEERWAFNLPSTTPPNWREIDESMAIERFRPEEPAPWRSSYTGRSEEHTSELQSLMRISYAVFCLKKKKIKTTHKSTTHTQIQ